MPLFERLRHPRRLVAAIMKLRFFKFGVVGVSGIFVSTALLYLCQEHLLTFLTPKEFRLNASLAVAILCATINNFTWNRRWTWADRGGFVGTGWLAQFGQYASACWVGIALQFLMTKFLSVHIYYLIANLCAIAVASGFNYALNDLWTFGGLRRWLSKRSAVSAQRRP